MLSMADQKCDNPPVFAAESQRSGQLAPTIALRRLPYPYRAMLSICSDLDQTPDRRVYWEISRFLNTTQAGPCGPGAGLEVGNTIYFDMPADQFAYWNTDDAGREMIRTLIHSGHIDCLHSYGSLATTRAHAQRALEELVRHDCRLSVWVDHSIATTNFGEEVTRGYGDVKGSPAYHADLMCAYGIKYVWRGRVTSVIGQDVSASLHGLLRWRHPLASGRTLAKEVAKQRLGLSGQGKYAMHGFNRVMRSSVLRDGRPVFEFMRTNPHWDGPGKGATAAGLADVLTERVLRRLIESEGIAIIYTHLGKVRNPNEPFELPTRNALHMLARRCRDGDILCAATSRLLRYLSVRDGLQYRVAVEGENVRITIVSTLDAAGAPQEVSEGDLQGITFITPRTAQPVSVQMADGTELPCETHHDEGRTTVCLPWKRLEFPLV